MVWKTRKEDIDKKNLYVSKINSGSEAEEGGVVIGSKLLCFNGEMIEDLGAKQIYLRSTQVSLPVTITFLKPATSSVSPRKPCMNLRQTYSPPAMIESGYVGTPSASTTDEDDEDGLDATFRGIVY